MEFGTARLRLPREERAEVVASLRESGLSVRAIAAATGDHYSTISRELSGVANATREHEVNEDALAEELIAAEAKPGLNTFRVGTPAHRSRGHSVPPATAATIAARISASSTAVSASGHPNGSVDTPGCCLGGCVGG